MSKNFVFFVKLTILVCVLFGFAFIINATNQLAASSYLRNANTYTSDF